ncbi:MAG TPA: fibronectin type III domain-containing protein [Usitatibacter sp.]|nr:fibronectin type III domain-containing protein [Usitatibacter sp.]
MKRVLSPFALVLLLAGFGATAMADPVVRPIATGTHAFDEADTLKYRLMSPTGATHPGGVMRWYYNDANRPAGISMSAVLSQLNDSMSKWSGVCNISFSYQGTTTTGFSLQHSPAEIDGVNVIGWDATNIAAPTTGITNIAWDSNNNIVDAEIRFNASYSATYSPASDFDATATHEIGHSIGIDHSDVAGQVMSGPPLTAYTGNTTLGSDDIAACVHLYGAPGGGSPGPDTQAPSVPTGLAATPVSTTQINLSWNASTDNVGVTQYRVFSSGTQIGSVAGTAASVGGLSANSTYHFAVQACDAAGNCSAQTAAVTAQTQAGDTTPPSVPTNLSATPISTSQVTLSWSASTDNVGVTGYNVYVGGTLLGTVANPSATVNNLSAGTTYTFNVSACDAAGNCSGNSTPAQATTNSSTPPPTSGCTGSQPPNDTQILACPTGQTGAITQSRSYSCVGSTWTPGQYQTVSNTCTSSTPTNTSSYQDLWWAGSQENGWGLTITQHQDALFLAWYIYDANGNPQWIVMPTGTWNSSHTSYSGALYIPSGSSFANYDSTKFAANGSVGTGAVTFTSASTATLTYTVGGVFGTKSIQREQFGVVDTSPIENYTDMWWGGTSQNGWGVVLTQQYHNIFAAWYTYNANGQTVWYVMPDGQWSGNTYSGALYGTHGSPVLGAAYNPAALVVGQVGTLSISFTDPNNASMTYTVNGVTQTKAISRLPF